MHTSLAFGTAVPAKFNTVCGRQQHKLAWEQARRASPLPNMIVDRADVTCSAALATSQTDVFNSAVHDSDVSGTTVTANTNTVTDSQTFAIAMATVGDDTKGKDIMLLHVEPLSSWTSYMLLITVSSKPQLNAVLARMEKEAEAVWHRPRTHKSPGSGGWEVLDYGDVVAHVMSEEMRSYYDMESFYGAAEEIDLPFTTEALPDNSLQWTQRLS
ncbi:hypothetical protein WJX77_001075 [Trebouxia sp. C0004]